ncbi:MAG TPA: lactate utilization protein [Terriglobia bacterium]|nr:lactate utilization protein [Terriglobia bacterium]
MPDNLSAWPDLGAVLPSVAPSELAARFEAELLSVGGSAHRVRSRADIARLLAGILTDRAAGVVLSRNPLLDRLDLQEIFSELGVPAWKWPADAASEPNAPASQDYREHCLSAGAGVTGVDFALVESGTLVLTSVTEGSQLASLASPVHIAFYRQEQVVATLEEVLARLPAPNADASPASGRSIVLITGTSRTADIEQILIRGVHGPRELHAVLVDD